MDKPRLWILAVKWPRAQTTVAGGADHPRDGGIPPVMIGRRKLHNAVKGRLNEVGKLHLVDFCVWLTDGAGRWSSRFYDNTVKLRLFALLVIQEVVSYLEKCQSG